MKKVNGLKVSEAGAAKMLGEITELFDDAESRYRTKYGNRVIENVAFYRGLQYFQKKFPQRSEQTDPRGEMTEVVNFSQTLINEGVADALSQVPNFKIASAKNDPRARGRADMTEKLAKSFLRNGVIDYDEIFNATLWSFICGGGWIKIGWDPAAGRHMPQGEDGIDDDAIDVGDNEDEPEMPLPYEGEIFIEYVNSVDGLPSATAKSAKPREMTHFFHRKLKSVRDCMNMWERDAFGKSTKGRWDTGSNSPEQQYARAASDEVDSSVGGNGSTPHADANQLAQIVEYWELPSRKFPEGRLLVFSGAMILFVGANPYHPARIPFVLFRGPNKIPDGIYPDGMMEALKPMQRSANKLSSKIMEIANKMANPHLLVPIGSSIDKNIWGNIPGAVIPYVKGYKPEILNAAVIPEWIFNHLNRQLDVAQFMTGMSDLTRGAGSSGSGRDRAFAEEQQQKLRGPHRQQQRNALLQVAQHCTWIARERYEDGRYIRVIGDGIDQIDIQEFRSDEYDWDNDFLPEAYDDEPLSLSQREATGREILASGGFEDTPAAERYRRYVGAYLGRTAAYDPFSKDRERAQRENRRIGTDPAYDPPVAAYDIHRIHLEEHNDFRKTPMFEQWPQHLKDKLNRHCEIHSMADQLVEAMALERENMLGMKPAGAPPGMNTSSPSPAQLPAGPGAESPADGGQVALPAPPPSIGEFNAMNPSEQRASDQR